MTSAAIIWMQPRGDYQRSESGYAIARWSRSPELTGSELEDAQVVDYFYLGCSHCRSFAPKLESLIRERGQKAALKRIPVTGGRPDLFRQATLFYALEDLGEIPGKTAAVFESVARSPSFPASDSDLANWAEAQGIDPVRLLAAFHAPGMRVRVEDGDRSFHERGLTSVPAVGVGRRFVVTPTTAGSIDGMVIAVSAAMIAANGPRL